MTFWDRVEKCKHEDLSPDYSEFVACPTPYCSGSETHCLDCGVYISDCGCHSSSGLSGWSQKRWKTHRKKKYEVVT